MPVVHLYAYFALPSMASDGLKITYAVVDLTAIRFIGADNGLGNFLEQMERLRHTHREHPGETNVPAIVRG
jgi:hypothetical protein